MSVLVKRSYLKFFFSFFWEETWSHSAPQWRLSELLGHEAGDSWSTTSMLQVDGSVKFTVLSTESQQQRLRGAHLSPLPQLLLHGNGSAQKTRESVRRLTACQQNPKTNQTKTILTQNTLKTTLNALNPRWEGLVRGTEEQAGGFARFCFWTHLHSPAGQTPGGAVAQNAGLELHLFQVSILPLLKQQPAGNRCRSERTAGAQLMDCFWKCVST